MQNEVAIDLEAERQGVIGLAPRGAYRDIIVSPPPLPSLWEGGGLQRRHPEGGRVISDVEVRGIKAEEGSFAPRRGGLFLADTVGIMADGLHLMRRAIRVNRPGPLLSMLFNQMPHLDEISEDLGLETSWTPNRLHPLINNPDDYAVQLLAHMGGLGLVPLQLLESAVHHSNTVLAPQVETGCGELCAAAVRTGEAARAAIRDLENSVQVPGIAMAAAADALMTNIRNPLERQENTWVLPSTLPANLPETVLPFAQAMEVIRPRLIPLPRRETEVVEVPAASPQVIGAQVLPVVQPAVVQPTVVQPTVVHPTVVQPAQPVLQTQTPSEKGPVYTTVTSEPLTFLQSYIKSIQPPAVWQQTFVQQPHPPVVQPPVVQTPVLQAQSVQPRPQSIESEDTMSGSAYVQRVPATPFLNAVTPVLDTPIRLPVRKYPAWATRVIIPDRIEIPERVDPVIVAEKVVLPERFAIPDFKKFEPLLTKTTYTLAEPPPPIYSTPSIYPTEVALPSPSLVPSPPLVPLQPSLIDLLVAREAAARDLALLDTALRNSGQWPGPAVTSIADSDVFKASGHGRNENFLQQMMPIILLNQAVPSLPSLPSQADEDGDTTTEAASDEDDATTEEPPSTEEAPTTEEAPSKVILADTSFPTTGGQLTLTQLDV